MVCFVRASLWVVIDGIIVSQGPDDVRFKVVVDRSGDVNVDGCGNLLEMGS